MFRFNRRVLRALVGTAVAVAIGFGGMAGAAHGAPEVTEDSPAWNCATMGDSECGPGVAPLSVPAWCWKATGRVRPDGRTNDLYLMWEPAGLFVTVADSGVYVAAQNARIALCREGENR